MKEIFRHSIFVGTIGLTTLLCQAEERATLLKNGQYQTLLEQTDSKKDGIWAFARRALIADKQSYQIALKAHQNDDILGTYGYEVDHKAGLAELQKASTTGHSYALGQLAYFYIQGLGVEKDYGMSAQLGKAAWIQGSGSSTRIIADCYEKDAELSKDESAAKYWKLQSMGGGLAFALGEDKPNAALSAELAEIDPFGIQLK